MANLVRFNDPFAGIMGLHSQLDDMFGNLVSSSQSSPRNIAAVDVYTEDDKRLVTEIQAPGFTKDDVDVNIHEGILEIKGEKTEKSEDKDKKRSYMLRESHTSFYRSIVLPKHADADNVTADFTDGVLKVVIPFKELPSPKKVEIRSGSAKQIK